MNITDAVTKQLGESEDQGKQVKLHSQRNRKSNRLEVYYFHDDPTEARKRERFLEQYPAGAVRELAKIKYGPVGQTKVILPDAVARRFIR